MKSDIFKEKIGDFFYKIGDFFFYKIGLKRGVLYKLVYREITKNRDPCMLFLEQNFVPGCSFSPEKYIWVKFLKMDIFPEYCHFFCFTIQESTKKPGARPNTKATKIPQRQADTNTRIFWSQRRNQEWDIFGEFSWQTQH